MVRILFILINPKVVIKNIRNIPTMSQEDFKKILEDEGNYPEDEDNFSEDISDENIEEDLEDDDDDDFDSEDSAME